MGLGLGLGVAVQRAVAPLANAAAAVAQCRLPVALTHKGRAAAVARVLFECALEALARDTAQHPVPLPGGRGGRGSRYMSYRIEM